MMAAGIRKPAARAHFPRLPGLGRLADAATVRASGCRSSLATPPPACPAPRPMRHADRDRPGPAAASGRWGRIPPPVRALLAAGLPLICRFEFHSGALGKMPRRVERAMSTPSHHRVGHGHTPRHAGGNAGTGVRIRERLFGTFVADPKA